MNAVATSLIGVGGTLVGTCLGAWLSFLAVARQRRSAERRRVLGLATEVIASATELKFAVMIHHQRLRDWSTRKPVLAGALATAVANEGRVSARLAHALEYVVQNWAMAPDEFAQKAISASGRLMNALAAVRLSGHEELKVAARGLPNPVGGLMQAAGKRATEWEAAEKSFDSALSKVQSTADRVVNNSARPIRFR